jgi:hypothetical protein
MKTWIVCGKDIYTREEKAKEILFKNANIEDFVKAFEFDGKEYFKKIN